MYFDASKQTIEIAKYQGMRSVIIFFIATMIVMVMIVIKIVVEIVIVMLTERNSSSGKYGHTEIVGDIDDDKC